MKPILRTAIRIVKRAASTGTTALLAIATALTPVAEAAQVQLQGANYNVRQNSDASEMPIVGVLAPGTVIDVPDQYFKDANGNRVPAQTALHNWLATAQGPSAPSDRQCNGQACTMFPVRIVRLGHGSTLPASQLARQDLHVALEDMYNNGRLIVLARESQVRAPETAAQPEGDGTGNGEARPGAKPPTRRPQPQTTAAPAPAPVRPAPAQHARPARDPNLGPSAPSGMEATCLTGDCGGRGQAGPVSADLTNYLARLNEHLPQHLRLSATGRAQYNSAPQNFVTTLMRDNFNSSCRPGPFANFEAMHARLVAEVRRAGIPLELMQGILNRESRATCTAISSEGAVGLFQIIPRYSSFPVCHPNNSSYNLASCREILRNPETNMSEAIRMMVANYRALISSGLFNASQMDVRTRWRVAALGYAKGAEIPKQARNALLRWNREHGTHLRPEVWAEFRPFLLDGYLNGGGPRQASVLGYVESVLPFSS